MSEVFDENRLNILLGILKPNRKTRIIDVGANPLTTSPYENLLSAQACEVWGFEPQKKAYEKLCQKNRPGETYFPNALGDGLTHTLHICPAEGFTSLLEPAEDTFQYLNYWTKDTQPKATQPLKTKRLDDIEDLPQPDLLKIDVQGSEKMIFENGRRALSKAVAIISEVSFLPLYKDQPLIHEQMKELETQGFLLTKFLFVKQLAVSTEWPTAIDFSYYGSQMIDGDAVFIRNLIQINQYTNEQLKHLAICADSIFTSFDISLKCLSVLCQRKIIQPQDCLEYIQKLP